MLALFLALALFAEPALARKPIDETIKLGGGFPVVNATIPVDDHRTKSIPGALYEPKGSGPFPVPSSWLMDATAWPSAQVP